jgi:ubiquinone biosynthesis protein UbiJ
MWTSTKKEILDLKWELKQHKALTNNSISEWSFNTLKLEVANLTKDVECLNKEVARLTKALEG